MTDINANRTLQAHIKAGYVLLYMTTSEEGRAELEVMQAAKATERSLFVWSITEGMYDIARDKTDKSKSDPVSALDAIQKMEPRSIFLIRDPHPHFKNHMFNRMLRDLARKCRQDQKTIIMVSPVNHIPPDLERDIVMIDFELPTKEQLVDIWDSLYQSNKAAFDRHKVEITDDDRDKIASAALGLTVVEAENAFSKATVMSLWGQEDKGGAPSIAKLVMQEKAAAVKKSGILEYFEAKERSDNIGGLGTLKKWLDVRSRAFSRQAREFGLPMPKGILLLGLPGCGKSLVAKASSNILNVPLIRFDISRVFGGVVGQSEQQMRSALQLIDRVGSCVVWVDEAEKAFAGVGGGGSNDSGTTKRVFGNFLTYMQEKEGASFVVMTINNIDSIQQSAPELLRKGRFDEIFFVGLPSSEERKEIFKIHIKAYNRDPESFNVDEMAKVSESFSGAEIEQAVIEGLYSAFYRDSDLTTEDVVKACKATNPLAKSSADSLEAMKHWAEENAVNASSESKDGVHAGRMIDI